MDNITFFIVNFKNLLPSKKKQNGKITKLLLQAVVHQGQYMKISYIFTN